MIIAPSLKKGPVSKLSNKLTSIGIPVHYPTSESEDIDKTIVNNKILFCTMHQSKGLERKAIILYNFDESYLMFNKTADSEILSNEMYVALTRSSLYISLLRHNTSELLGFFDNILNKLISNNIIVPIVYDKYKKVKRKDFESGVEVIHSVTSLLKHITYDIIDDLYNCIKIEEIVKPGIELELVTKTYQKQQDLYEQVSDITGTAIPAYYEYIKTGTTSILEAEKSQSSGRKFKEFNFSNISTGYSKNNFRNDDNIDNITIDLFIDTENDKTDKNEKEDKKDKKDKIDVQNFGEIPTFEGTEKMKIFQKMLYLSNKKLALTSGVDAKMQQIENYNWISEYVLDKCMERLSNNMSSNIEYEVMCEGNIKKKKLAGYIDAIDHDTKTILEFKCTQNIEKEHIIQLFLYLILNERKEVYKNYTYKIFNIRTGQVFKIDKNNSITNDHIDNCILNLFKYKNDENMNTISSEEFIKNTIDILNR